MKKRSQTKQQLQDYDPFARVQFLEGLVGVSQQKFNSDVDIAKRYFDEKYPNRSPLFDEYWLTKRDTGFMAGAFGRSQGSIAGTSATRRIPSGSLQDIAQKVMMGRPPVFWNGGANSRDLLKGILYSTRPGYETSFGPKNDEILGKLRANILGVASRKLRVDLARAQAAQEKIREQGGDMLVPRPGEHEYRGPAGNRPRTRAEGRPQRRELSRLQPDVFTNINESAAFRLLRNEKLLDFVLKYTDIDNRYCAAIREWFDLSREMRPSERGDKYYVYHGRPFLEGIPKNPDKRRLPVVHLAVLNTILARDVDQLERAFRRGDKEEYNRLAEEIKVKLDGPDGHSGLTATIRTAMGRLRNKLITLAKTDPRLREVLGRMRERSEIREGLGYRSMLTERPAGGWSIYASMRKNARSKLLQMMGRKVR